MKWRIYPSQRGRVNKLVRRRCCCYDHGNCILLDDGEPHCCVQIISRSGIYCTISAGRCCRPTVSCMHKSEIRINEEDTEMKTIHNTKIIGIDHGYGNMKTANFCFSPVSPPMTTSRCSRRICWSTAAGIIYRRGAQGICAGQDQG